MVFKQSAIDLPLPGMTTYILQSLNQTTDLQPLTSPETTNKVNEYKNEFTVFATRKVINNLADVNGFFHLANGKVGAHGLP